MYKNVKHGLAPLLHLIEPLGDAKILLLILVIVIAGMLGLHPVVPVVAIGQVLPPDVLGLPPVMIGVAYISTWALGTVASPVSATSLFIARMVDQPILRVAWRWNGPYALVAAVAAGLLIMALNRLGLF